MNRLLNKLKSYDYVIILYILFTGIYMSFNFTQLENVGYHIILRLIILLIIFIFLSFNSNQKFFLFLRNFYPLILLGFFYSETGFYNHLIFENFDPALIRIENSIFGNQLALEFSKAIPNKWFSEIMHFGYFSYYILTFGIPFLFYIKVPEKFDKTMFIVIMSFCIYYIIFILFPSVGPQFYFPTEQTGVPEGVLFDKIMKIIIDIGESETGAFPSSHVGITIVFLILLLENFRKYISIPVLLSIILILSTVYLKAHYAIDVIAGILSGIILFFVSSLVYSRLEKIKLIR